MKEALKEKFEQILESCARRYNVEGLREMFYWQQEDKIELTIRDAMQAAYDLAKAESEEIINSQQELLESMGETNKQLAKRLLAVQHEIELDHTPSKCVNAIKLILNPPQQ